LFKETWVLSEPDVLAFAPKFTKFTGMGTFHVGARIENIIDRSKGASLSRMLVDTGSEYTWVPGHTLENLGVEREKKDLEFVMANGQKVTRSVGFAIIRVDKNFTVDEVVFAEKGDLLLLGARSLEGLSLVVDSRKKMLLAAGPLPAARAGVSGER
jgi:predicted aspartyl protease